MEMYDLVVSCPKNSLDSFETYSFFLDVQRIIKNTEKKSILLDMSRTKVFDTNILALFYMIIEEKVEEKKHVSVRLPNGEDYLDRRVLIGLFNYYAIDRRAFFKPRLVVGNSNVREIEDLLLKYLKYINLKHYSITKTLISELIANIKMHVKRVKISAKGYLAATRNQVPNRIIITIVNDSKTIKETLQSKKYMFEDDFSAILWALRKNNSTRDDEESGGIGLYLLRKYINKLGGEADIISGKCYMKLDENCFNRDNENEIMPKEVKELQHKFDGTMINLRIPYEVYEIKDNEDKEELSINLLDIVEV